jgi:hypothetical protein
LQTKRSRSLSAWLLPRLNQFYGYQQENCSTTVEPLSQKTTQRVCEKSTIMKLHSLIKYSAAALVLCGVAMADSGKNGNNTKNDVFMSGIVGSVPGQTMFGVQSGGLPWVIREGKARLDKNGKLHVEVEGLLLTNAGANTGTTGTVRMVSATLFCGGVATASSTPVVPLAPTGFAEMEGKVGAPANCMSPVVLVRIAASVNATTPTLGRFIALSGASVEQDVDANKPDNDVNDDHRVDPNDSDRHGR